MMGENSLQERFSPKLEGMDRFLSDAGSGMLFPIIPLFAAAALGAPAILIGLAESIPAFFSQLPRLLPEEISRDRKLRASAIALCAIARPLTAQCSSFPEFISLRSADSAAEKSAFPNGQLQTGKTPFGAQLQNHGGTILGALLAILLLFFLGSQASAADSYRTIILLSAVPAALVLIPFLLTKEKYYSKNAKENAPALPQSISAPLAISSAFLLSKAGILLFLLAASASLPPVLVVLSYLIFLASKAAFPLPSRLLCNALGQKKAFILGCMLFSMAALSFSLPLDAQLSIALFAFLGFSSTLLDSAYNEDDLPLAGKYPILSGALLIGANLIAGLLWGEHFAQMHAPFLFSCALSLASVFAFSIYADEKRH
ncbi:hypothetical protein JW721_01345 [Candidatus Micrarchaeota archaeon]|nr:hypothetical protein [Candidatus Micrarchaeota archaeon]